MLKPTLTAIVTQTGNSSKTSSDSVSVEMVENIVQGIIIKQIECSQNIEKRNELIGDKLANMITLANFQGKVIELMLQNKYYQDSRGKKAYEQIQEDAMNAISNSLEGVSDTNNLKLHEELITAKNEIAELQEAMHKANQEKTKLQQDIEFSREKATRADSQANMAVEGLRSYIKLTEWYETMIEEMKKNEDRNVKWYQTYKWRGGMDKLRSK